MLFKHMFVIFFRGSNFDPFFSKFLHAEEWPKTTQEWPKSGQERPKSGPRAAKSGPRAAKSGPRAARERPKSSPRAAKSGPERPKSGQERPKSSQRAAKSGHERQRTKAAQEQQTVLKRVARSMREAHSKANKKRVNPPLSVHSWVRFWPRSTQQSKQKACESPAFRSQLGQVLARLLIRFWPDV